MRFRVDELAARAGVSVDTIRFYQGKGLLAPPEREGRIAWYSADHASTLERIRDLKDKGFTLASIRRILAGDLDAADVALVAAVAGSPGALGEGEWLTLDELARETGVSPALLAAVEREGVLVPRMRGGRPMYTRADAAAVSAGLELLAAGIPLPALLELGRAHEKAMREVAERAVDLFDAYVRRPLLAESGTGADTGERLVAAFSKMLPATTALVAHHFGRVLLSAARDRVGRQGAEPEGRLEASER
ncbi:MAG TPA: MerR family transcriptional regulator [Actinomycetota bacterium]|nr:MerR family transcriptional regulator [Actinomycetota bacterium]